MRKFLKYSCWTIAAILASIGILKAKMHLLAIAGLWFIMGTFQDEEDDV